MNKFIRSLFNVFAIDGKPIMGIWSMAMIGISVYSIIYDKKIDSSVAIMYGVAVGFYANTVTKRDALGNGGGDA